MNYVRLIFSILIANLAGLIGGLFTKASVSTWYVTLIKPSFNPPSYVFGPVWTLLYILMGISFYLIWEKDFKTKLAKLALNLFFLQLILNALWSILFFGLQAPLFSFIELILLFISILATTLVFYQVSKPAAYLLIPYLLWVLFAGLLSYRILVLN